MTGFADMVDALAENPDFTSAGAFTPNAPNRQTAGLTVPCRVNITRIDRVLGTLGTTRVRNPAWKASLFEREVTERPITGDTLEVLEGHFAGLYVVHDVREDPEGLTWDLEVGLAP